MRTRRDVLARVATALVLATASSSIGAQPAPTAGSARAWKDTSVHRSGFVMRDGVRLHFLDWGGSGQAVVLLPGYGLTAHAFDGIAGRLAREFHVVAVTPRGYGESDAPPDTAAYTVATMVADLEAVLDSLAIERAALVGHSISGVTIATFAIAHPDRVTKLVFLDAFPYWAAVGGDSIEALSPVSAPGFSGAMTYERVGRFLARYRFGGWSPALEADLRANVLGDELGRRQALTGHYVSDAREHAPDLGRLRVPALQLCAAKTLASEYGWLASGTPEHARAARYLRGVLGPFDRRLCARFTTLVPAGRTIDVAGSHYVFFLRPAQAARLVAGFLRQ